MYLRFMLCVCQRASSTHLIPYIRRSRRDSTMRKMQVPAYWPTVLGVQALEKSGVVCEVTKTMFMPDIEDVSLIGVLEPISMPDMVEDESMDMVIVGKSVVNLLKVVDVCFADYDSDKGRSGKKKGCPKMAVFELEIPQLRRKLNGSPIQPPSVARGQVSGQACVGLCVIKDSQRQEVARSCGDPSRWGGDLETCSLSRQRAVR